MQAWGIRRVWLIAIAVALLFIAGCGGSSGESAIEAVKTARSGEAELEALDRLQREKGELLVGAYCSTVGYYTAEGRIASKDQLANSILYSFGSPNNGVLREIADQLGTALYQAEHNAPAAMAYARGCLLWKNR